MLFEISAATTGHSRSIANIYAYDRIADVNNLYLERHFVAEKEQAASAGSAIMSSNIENYFLKSLNGSVETR